MKPPTTDPALILDTMSELFTTGASLPNALWAIGTFFPGCKPLTTVATQLTAGIAWETAWQHTTESPHLNQLSQELRFVYASAVPSAHMLTVAATALRTNRKRTAEQLAQELAIRLVLPIGICLLPSFILLGIIPMVFALWPG